MSEIKALVCDDDDALRELMVRRLTRQGIEPDQAADGQAGLDMIAKTSYDLIVTDIYMPGVTGLEMVEKAKERDPQTQVVVVTASATVENAIEALNVGAFSYITKPFDHLSVFDNAVSRALEFRRLIVDNQRMAEEAQARAEELEAEVSQKTEESGEELEQLRSVLESLPLGVVLVRPDGHPMLKNARADDWIQHELRSGRRSIMRFLEAVHEVGPDAEEPTRIGNRNFMLLAPGELAGPSQPRLVLIREIEPEALADSDKLVAALANLKMCLGTLYRGDWGDETARIVESMARSVSDVQAAAGLTDEELKYQIAKITRAEGSEPPAEVVPGGPAEAQTPDPEAEAALPVEADGIAAEQQVAPQRAEPEPAAKEAPAKAASAEKPPPATKHSGLLRKGRELFGQEEGGGRQDERSPETELVAESDGTANGRNGNTSELLRALAEATEEGEDSADAE